MIHMANKKNSAYRTSVKRYYARNGIEYNSDYEFETREGLNDPDSDSSMNHLGEYGP